MTTPSSSFEMPGSDTSLSAYGTARTTIAGEPLGPDELRKIDAYWRASLYLCIGMMYLKANPLLREPLHLEHTKPRLLGHWGSDAGQCFTYIHFNRLIKKYDLNAISSQRPRARGAGGAVAGVSRRARTPRSTRTRAKSWPGCSASSGSSPFPAALAATPPPKRRAAFTRAANSATASRMPTGRFTTTRN